jgi:hypothetical protein
MNVYLIAGTFSDFFASESFEKILATVVALVGSYFILPLLKKKSEQAKEDLKNANLKGKELLVARVKEHVWEGAESLVEKEFPVISAKIAAGELNEKDEVKAELRRLGKVLKANTIKVFKDEGTDLLAELGDAALDGIIENIANKVSPFPGKETAKVLLQGHVTNWIIDKGVAGLADKVAEWDEKKDADVKEEVKEDGSKEEEPKTE